MIIGCMIVLNEEQFIGRSLEFHLPWVDKMVIVEGCDGAYYPRDRVTADGLSTDATAEIIRSFPDPDLSLIFVQHGFAGDRREGHAKVVLRDRYAQVIRENKWEGLMIHIDADEFYLPVDQKAILQSIDADPDIRGISIPQVHFWKSTNQIITGKYFDVGHTRFWRIAPGMHYGYHGLSSHNFPCDQRGKFLHRNSHMRHDRRLLFQSDGGATHHGPVCYHYGFCKSHENMADKTKYYADRGERISRPEITASRAAWFSDELIPGLKVHPWVGPVPFQLEPSTCHQK